MENDTVVEEVKNSFVWKRKFTIVLIINAIYIFLFYLLMQRYS